MTSPREQKVLAYILAHPGLDDDQLAARLKISPRQAINQVARRLAAAGAIRRTKASGEKITNHPPSPRAISGPAQDRVPTALIRRMVERWVADDDFATTWANRNNAEVHRFSPNWETAGQQRHIRWFTIHDEGRDIELRIFDTDSEGWGFRFIADGSPAASFGIGITGSDREFLPRSHAQIIGDQVLLRFPPRSQVHDHPIEIAVGSESATLDELWTAGLELMRKSDRRTAGEKTAAEADDPANVSFALVQVRTRQAVFRRRLMDAYGGRCAISACDVSQLLTAAHIVPWSQCRNEPWANHACNGLLLRVDLHVLFDAGYFDIVEKDGRHLVKLKRPLQGVDLRHGQVLRPPATPAARPHGAYLAERRRPPTT